MRLMIISVVVPLCLPLLYLASSSCIFYGAMITTTVLLCIYLYESSFTTLPSCLLKKNSLWNRMLW